MLQFEVEAKTRSSFGKGPARQMRRAGKTPGVLYGAGNVNTPLEVETKPFTKTLLTIQGQNAVISLKVLGAEDQRVHHVMVKEVQVDPVKDTLVHADFYEIDVEKPLTLSVPLKFSGKAKGVDMGGEMHISKNSVRLRGKVLDIPNDITVNVSGLGVGDKLTYNDVAVPAGVTLEDAAGTVVVSVQEASAAAKAAAEAEEEE